MDLFDRLAMRALQMEPPRVALVRAYSPEPKRHEDDQSAPVETPAAGAETPD